MQTMRYRTSGGEGERVRRGAISRVAGMVALTVALGMIGFLVAGSVASSATQSNGTVSLRKDRNAKSSCNGSCARFWPPLLSRAKPTAGTGVNQSLLGGMRRSNGSLQVTYNKHPLYTYALDKQAGQTKGEGNSLFGAKWWAVSAKGRAIVRVPTTSTGSTTTTTTTSCAYPPCP